MKSAELISLIISILGFVIMVITLLAKKDTFTLRLKCIIAKLACALVIVRCVLAIVGYCTGDDKLVRWFGTTPMPFSTAICLSMLALCISWVVDMMEKQWTNNKVGEKED
jgi:hypothetical protein